ncbi:hypothetical protein Tco_0954492 [Tanacetum coccineum]|uniref:Retroviral polymerase SH3-like domain-containing protein n=1 Tax=Tanacetum coccineum TaxID=301880 RepID=A0ABQ5E4J3_9ASTR
MSVLPSTGVNNSTEAHGSKPRSNTKKNRIMPAKKENKKKVESHRKRNTTVGKLDVVINGDPQKEICLRRNVVQVILWYLDIRLLKNYVGESFKAHEFCGKVIGHVSSEMDQFEPSWDLEIIGYCEDLGKFQAKADIGIFVGYAPSRKGYRIYNKRTRRLMETIHVTFDGDGSEDGSCSAQSSSRNVNSAEPNQVNYPPDHLRRWTKDHPWITSLAIPSRLVSTR